MLPPMHDSLLPTDAARGLSSPLQSIAAKRSMSAAKGMASVFALRGKLSLPGWTTNRSVACTSSAAKAKPLLMRGVALRLACHSIILANLTAIVQLARKFLLIRMVADYPNSL